VLIGPDQFLALNMKGDLAHDGWDNPERPKLWRYNQHYFDDLNASGASSRREWHQVLLSRWIAENPPGVGSGWEPYPTSLRIVNWIRYALSGGAVSDKMHHSLAVQARWLMQRLEWHILGNHLFVNAKALWFAGLYFDGPEATVFRDTARRILTEQIPEQILPDGGHFELSPMYHALAVDDLLDLVNLANTYDDGVLRALASSRISSMLIWLQALSHPDGSLGLFNDSADGIAPDTKYLLEYATRLKIDVPSPPAMGITEFRDSGYFRLAKGKAIVLADVARVGPDYLPGHAHADSLSFELTVQGRRIVVNGGTGEYGTGAERQRQRGTSAHSTIGFDGHDSSEVWGGFRTGRRARPLEIKTEATPATLSLSGAHDGYRFLAGRPIHRRSWKMTENCLLVQDRIDGRPGTDPGPATLRFLLGPGVQVAEGSDHLILHDSNGDQLARVTTDQPQRMFARPCTWHPEFGKTVPIFCLHLPLVGGLPRTVTTSFEWCLK
jgi:uncharacterized heparinase superfamily protein